MKEIIDKEGLRIFMLSKRRIVECLSVLILIWFLYGLVIGGIITFRHTSEQHFMQHGLYLLILQSFQKNVLNSLITSWVAAMSLISTLIFIQLATKSDRLARLLSDRMLLRLVYFFLITVIFLNALFSLICTYRSRSFPNIILISIDTLRSDHLGCYGYPRSTSPWIDYLSRHGALFTECMSPIPITTPSHASLFSSSYPYQHGVADNNFRGFFLKPKILTMAEILKNQGYHNAGIVSGFTMKKDSGFDQGFDFYNDDFVIQHRTASDVNIQAQEWLIRANNPFFLFLHYFEPHGSYLPTPPYDHIFPREMKPGNIERIPEYQRIYNISNPMFYITQYDGEIRLVDNAFGSLMKFLYTNQKLHELLLIFTSDHGESLIERTLWFDHGLYVYDEQVRMPFIISFPSSFSIRISDCLIQNIDILPTVLDLLSVKPPSQLKGISAKPVLTGEKREIRDFIFTESARGKKKMSEDIKARLESKKFSIRSLHWKMIRTNIQNDVRYMLYDLDTDPEEQSNLFQNKDISKSKKIQILKYNLDEFVQKNYAAEYFQKDFVISNSKSTLDENTVNQLKAIGYLDN